MSLLNFKKYVLIISMAGMTVPAQAAGLGCDAATIWSTIRKKVHQATPSFVASGYKCTAKTATQITNTIKEKINVHSKILLACGIGVCFVSVWEGVRTYSRMRVLHRIDRRVDEIVDNRAAIRTQDQLRGVVAEVMELSQEARAVGAEPFAGDLVGIANQLESQWLIDQQVQLRNQILASIAEYRPVVTSIPHTA